MTATALCFLLLGLPAAAQPITEVHQLRFHSDLLMNLHHTLYAAAWARRPQGGTPRALAGALPAPLKEDGLSAEERTAWPAAIDYYDRRLASKDLLFDDGMYAIKMAIADSDLSRPVIGSELRAMLEAATPVYRRHFWPEHDRANRAWIAATAASLETIAARAIARLEQVYDTRWFTAPVRVDVVRVGSRQGAYTTLDPTHIVISSGDPEHKGWASVEIVFHEASHVLVSKIAAALNGALADGRREHGQLWHVVQFYLTGAVVQEVLRSRGVDYTPYMYATGLFDRAWGRYRRLVEETWKPYLDGKVTADAAVAATMAGLSQ